MPRTRRAAGSRARCGSGATRDRAGALPRLPASRHRAGVSACSRPWHGESGRVPGRAQACCAAEHNGELLEHDAEAQRWAAELRERAGKGPPNLALLSRDDCPPSLHAAVMLSRGKIQESGDGEAWWRRGARRDGVSLLGDVQEMCGSVGTFFATVGGQYQQALDMFEFTLLCTVALEGHDSLDVAASYTGRGNVHELQGKYEEQHRGCLLQARSRASVRELSEMPRHYCPAGRP